MSKTIFVTGTGTEIGKTWVAAETLKVLRQQGVEVHARKPAQSFEVGGGPTDAEILGAASGEEAVAVCPEHRSYPLPLAPPMAAEALERAPFSIEDLAAETALPPSGLTFVEGAGGPRSPLADDGDSVALAEALEADIVLLVGDAELGTINSIQLSHDVFQPRRVVVYLNRYDGSRELHLRNLAWLRDVCGMEVVTDPEDLVRRLTQEDG